MLHVNEFVSADRLVEEAWSGRPPPGAAGTLQTYISRLRRLLADTGASLTTRGDGYELCVDPADFDVTCFRRLTSEGRVALAAGHPRGACELLESALALWQGDPLADLADEDFAVEVIRNLEEERLAAEIDRIDAGLDLGWSDVAFVGDLRRLVDRYPHDERIRERLMVALYRSGRQAEALEAYRDARTTLLNDFGIDPSERLRALERAILRQDPTLDAPELAIPREPADDRAAVDRGHVRPRIGRAVIVAGAAAALLLAAIVAVVGIRRIGEHSGTAWQACCTEAAILNARDGGLESGIRLKTTPTAIAAYRGALWVTSSSSGSLDRADIRTRSLTRIAVGGTPAGVAVTRGDVWVADSSGRDLVRVSAKKQQVIGRLDVCNGPLGLAVGIGALWVACPLDGTLVEINPGTSRVKRRIPVGPSPTAAVVAAGDVWVTLESAGEVARYDPRTRSVTTIAVGEGPSAIAAGQGEVWVANSLNHTIARLNSSSGAVDSVTPVRTAPEALAAVDGGVWSAEPGAMQLRFVSDATSTVTRTVRTPNPIVALTAERGQIDAAASLSATRRRGGTVRIAVQAILPTRPDPALSFNTAALQVEVITNDGLLAFRRTGGPMGQTLVPDLATALPSESDSGRVWSVSIRRGVFYSTGRPVRAADIRYGFERAFEAGSMALPLYDDIVGASRCHAHHRCRLSRGIAVHGRKITFRLDRPDSDFPEKLALPFADAVPVGWPLPTLTPKGTTGVVPATGPYRISGYTPGRRFVLTRNHRFRLWSADAQPAGYPDRIVEESEPNLAQLGTAIRQKRIEVASLAVGSDLRWVRARYPSQVVEDADPASEWEATNTRRPPFNDVRVRRALAYAVNRDMAARAVVGARPSCQILPPAFPGYTPYCPYSAPPGRTWRGPDLARARRLVNAAGATGDRVRVILARGYVNDTQTIRTALHQLGFRATFVSVPIQQWANLVGRTPARFDLASTGWGADYPAPSDFFSELFTCESFVRHTVENPNLPGFCSRRIDRMITRADRLEIVSSARANRMWTNVDHAIAWQAPVIPLYSFGDAAWVSPRVRNYMYNPFAGVLLDQIWRASPSR